MHQRVKNEYGYTLIYVLLTITLIFIFSAVLVTANINYTKQFSKTKDKVQTTHLAEMGLQFFSEVLGYTLAQPVEGENIQEARDNLAGQLIDNLASMGITARPAHDGFYEFQVNMPNNENTFYKVIYKFYVAEGTSGADVIRLTYRLTSGNPSIPITQPYQEEDRDYAWTYSGGIENPGGGGTPSDPVYDNPEESGCINNPSCNIYIDEPTTAITLPLLDENNNTVPVTEVTNLYTTGPLNLTNANKETELIVHGDLYVNNTTTLDNHTTINVTNGSAYFGEIDSKPNAQSTIIGDAYFYGNVFGIVGSGNSGVMCIEGTAHLKDDINIKPSDITVVENLNCSTYDPQGGIFARGVTTFTESFPTAPGWTSSEPGGGGIDLDPSYN